MVYVVLSQQIYLINKNRDDLLNTIRYDEDDETSVSYVKRIDELYGSFEDILIKLSKLKEALLGSFSIFFKNGNSSKMHNKFNEKTYDLR